MGNFLLAIQFDASITRFDSLHKAISLLSSVGYYQGGGAFTMIFEQGQDHKSRLDVITFKRAFELPVRRETVRPS